MKPEKQPHQRKTVSQSDIDAFNKAYDKANIDRDILKKVFHL